MIASLLTFSLLVSEDFWVFLSCLSDGCVLYPPDKFAENIPIAGKMKKKTEVLTN